MNTLFPGRPDYTGPTEGWFGLLHHDLMYEYSSNVMERVNYVKCKKQRHEIATRLYNMIYLEELGDKCKALEDDYQAKLKPVDDYWANRELLNDDYWAKLKLLEAEILAYIKHHIPDCAWNGTELAFPQHDKVQP